MDINEEAFSFDCWETITKEQQNTGNYESI